MKTCLQKNKALMLRIKLKGFIKKKVAIIERKTRHQTRDTSGSWIRSPRIAVNPKRKTEICNCIKEGNFILLLTLLFLFKFSRRNYNKIALIDGERTLIKGDFVL